MRSHRIRAALRGLALAVIGVFLLPAVAVAHKHGPTGTFTEWNWPDAPANPDGKVGYRDFHHRLTIEATPDDPEEGYFWSHQVGLKDGETAYFGLQTLGHQRPDGSFGRVAIFSIWEALAARGPGIAQRFGGEGVGFQTLIPYDWQVDRTYALRMFKSGESRRGTEWTGTVRDESTGVVSVIGTITVPKKWGYLDSWSIMWTERYTGREVLKCSDLGYARARFETPTANNGRITPDNHRNFTTEPANCPNSRVRDVPNGSRQEMGVPK